MTYTVAVYEIDQAYGGPEEGGWWFNTGIRRKVLGTVEDEATAYARARRLNDALNVLQADLRPVSSVAYSGGRFAVEVYEGEAPEAYPTERPYYC